MDRTRLTLAAMVVFPEPEVPATRTRRGDGRKLIREREQSHDTEVSQRHREHHRMPPTVPTRTTRSAAEACTGAGVLDWHPMNPAPAGRASISSRRTNRDHAGALPCRLEPGTEPT